MVHMWGLPETVTNAPSGILNLVHVSFLFLWWLVIFQKMQPLRPHLTFLDKQVRMVKGKDCM